MEEIKRQQALRFAYLKRVYELSDGNSFQAVETATVRNELGLSNDEGLKVEMYLAEEHLIAFRGMGALNVNITHWGIKEVEAALTKPDEATSHFLPVNVIYANTISNSPIQQGNVASSQTITIIDHRQELAEFLDRLRRELPQVELDARKQQIVESNAAAVESQLDSPEPNDSIVRAGLSSIRSVLEEASGNVVAAGLLTSLNSLV